jgi:transposase
MYGALHTLWAQGQSKKAIARQTGLDVKTVRKWLKRAWPPHRCPNAAQAPEPDPREVRRKAAWEWMHAILQASTSAHAIVRDQGDFLELKPLFRLIVTERLSIRNKALAVLANRRGIPAATVCDFLDIDKATYWKYVRSFKQGGIKALLARKISGTRKFDDEEMKQAIFSTLHQPPHNYDINRTAWTMDDLARVLHDQGHPACKEVIRKIIKDAGFRWRKARIVLTSKDPEYRAKLNRIHELLADLQEDEAFFSIDEFGPVAIKMQGGKSLTAPGEQRVVPQWQQSKGCLIMTATVELSGNQVTHFYSDKKNTAEMIRMAELLVEKYQGYRKIYLSWDAASWHISKKLNEWITHHNALMVSASGPIVETAPLPSGAQFLNVIESVLSGMARAIIHNSDYKSVDEAKEAIDRHFANRNAYFKLHPRRAGKKIWGKEREPSTFSDANNCKDPLYR